MGASFFDRVYYDLHAPLFSEAESRAEVAAALELLGLPAGSRVLDLPCGWGRHTNLLGDAAIEALGLDLSLPLLRRARAAPERAAAAYACADMRALPCRSAALDAVLNIGSNLSVFTDDADALAAAREMRRVLRPGGVLLLETMHRDDVVASFAARDRWSLPDGTQVRARRRFDPVAGISYEVLRWRNEERQGQKRHALRLRTATELDTLLRAAEFDTINYYGDWDGRRLGHASPRLIAIAAS